VSVKEEDRADERSISPQAPLLAGYITSILCQSGKLSAQGRTLSAIIIGLGDEEVDSSQNTSVLVYGQSQVVKDGSQSGSSKSTLRLCMARRKIPPPPPSVQKVRPGDPLPRGMISPILTCNTADSLAPLFFPSRSFSKKLSHRPLSRTTSSASIYTPPVLQHSISAPIPVVRTHSLSKASTSTQLPPAPISGRTPGRRGEKRKRSQAEEEVKKRKSGKVVVDKEGSLPKGDVDGDADEDIFGKHPSIKSAISFELPVGDERQATNPGGVENGGEGLPSTAKKRPRVPQQVLDNKAVGRLSCQLRDQADFASLYESRQCCSWNRVAMPAITNCLKRYSAWLPRGLILLS
jgi:hypothetical protein